MANISRQLFQPIFEDKLHLLKNTFCHKCDATKKHALIPWIVGDQFHKTQQRVLFVGKPHRGEPGKKLSSGLLDATEDVQKRFGSQAGHAGVTHALSAKSYLDRTLKTT